MRPAWVELVMRHTFCQSTLTFFVLKPKLHIKQDGAKGEAKIKMAAFVIHNTQCNRVYGILIWQNNKERAYFAS